MGIGIGDPRENLQCYSSQYPLPADSLSRYKTNVISNKVCILKAQFNLLNDGF